MRSEKYWKHLLHELGHPMPESHDWADALLARPSHQHAHGNLQGSANTIRQVFHSNKKGLYYILTYIHICCLTEFAKLIQEMWTSNVHSVTPMELKRAFSTKHRMYSDYNQQDAQEFLRFFLDSLHSALNTGVKGETLNIDDNLRWVLTYTTNNIDGKLIYVDGIQLQWQ